MLVLLDTTILTNFARVGLTQVMTDLWGEQVCTTVDALDEYRTGISVAGLAPLAWHQLNILTLTPEEKKHNSRSIQETRPWRAYLLGSSH